MRGKAHQSGPRAHQADRSGPKVGLKRTDRADRLKDRTSQQPRASELRKPSDHRTEGMANHHTTEAIPDLAQKRKASDRSNDQKQTQSNVPIKVEQCQSDGNAAVSAGLPIGQVGPKAEPEGAMGASEIPPVHRTKSRRSVRCLERVYKVYLV